MIRNEGRCRFTVSRILGLARSKSYSKVNDESLYPVFLKNALTFLLKKTKRVFRNNERTGPRPNCNTNIYAPALAPHHNMIR